MDNKEVGVLSDLKDLVVFGRIEKEVEIIPPEEYAKPMTVVVQSLTSKEKKELHKTIAEYNNQGPYLFEIILEEHILAWVVKSINGRPWRNRDEALAFFGSIQDRFRTFLYEECYAKIIGQQDTQILETYAGIKGVEKLKNSYLGDSPEAPSGSPSEDIGTS